MSATPREPAVIPVRATPWPLRGFFGLSVMGAVLAGLGVAALALLWGLASLVSDL
jgi:hypothetical protein